ncbi:MAG: lysine exporter LysO family protein [Fervidobacterium sp.]|nr:lysine exporter LysO family protein [Fervidobacterium sp.]
MSVILLLSSVILGLISGRTLKFHLPDGSVSVVLYLLVFLVGLDLSKEKIEKRFIKDISLVIISTISGTIFFVLLLSFFLPLKKLEVLAAASGFGWYSLSSVIISTSYNAYLGSISFFSNVIRELIAIIIAPFGIKKSRYGTISVAGATSMDTLLGLITIYSDRETALVSFGHGFFISIMVPFSVNFFLSFIK